MDADGYDGFILEEEQSYLPFEVNTGNRAKILPRKWFGINPNTETHEQLNEVHCPIPIAQETFRAANPGQIHLRQVPTEGPVWSVLLSGEMAQTKLFFSEEDNYMRQFIELGYL